MLASMVRVILAASILTPGIGVSQPVQPLWSNIVNEPGFKVDIDNNSIKLIIRNNGFEFLSRLRMDFGKPFVIPGKTKAGAYYVNEVSAQCKTNSFSIEKSTVYSRDGEMLATGKDVATIPNPNISKSFISVWLHMACNQYKNKRPPSMI